MAFATNLSRFDLLTDDARDPFEKKKKADKSTTTTKAQKKGAGKGSGQAQGQSAGKKKKNNSNINVNIPPPRQEEEYPELGAKAPEPPEPEVWSNVPSRNNQNNNGSQVHPKERKTKDQWSEWTKRDDEFVTDSFETDLEAALLQSKLDFHDQQEKLKTTKNKKSKKKGVTVSLPSFNDMLSSGKSDSFEVLGNDTPGQHTLNGFGDGQVMTGDEDDPRMTQFRLESQMEIQRERQIALERKLINSRTPILTVPSERVKQSRDPAQLVLSEIITEKDNIIAQISSEKAELEKEIDLLKIRFKKICSVFGEAQLKDKATLVNELEKVTKLNHDQNDTIQELHSLLEQEKSKYSAAQSEIRKLNEQSRRRNPHSESTAQ